MILLLYLIKFCLIVVKTKLNGPFGVRVGQNLQALIIGATTYNHRITACNRRRIRPESTTKPLKRRYGASKSIIVAQLHLYFLIRRQPELYTGIFFEYFKTVLHRYAGDTVYKFKLVTDF